MAIIGLFIGLFVFAMSCIITNKKLRENYLTYQDKKDLKIRELIVSIILGLQSCVFTVGICFFSQINLENFVWIYLVLFILFSIILSGLTILIYITSVNKLLRDCKKATFTQSLYYLIKQEIELKHANDKEISDK